MKQQPDHLFHNKLEQLHIPAPEAAWNRIQSNLDKKRGILWMWKVAAAVIPLAVAAFYIIPNDSTTTEATTAEVIKPTPTVIEQSANASAAELASGTTAIATTEKKKNAVKKKEVHSADAITHEVISVIETTNSIVVSDNTEVLQSEIQHENTIVTTVSIEETIASTTLIVPAEEVNQKYLIDPSLLDATSGEQTTSSFQRLLEKAADLKNSKHGLGNLRQAKNEILALNFKNKKRERNN